VLDTALMDKKGLHFKTAAEFKKALVEVSPEEAAEHPARGQLTRFVGMPGEPLPEARIVPFEPGDTLLLCSDGLHGLLSPERICALLNAQDLPLESVSRQLVAAANEAGGTDNITALLIRAAITAVATEHSAKTTPS
jgi:serine/threonine protein phosphatase PrpC